MTSTIENTIIDKIKNHFEDSKFLNESKKSKITLINVIHRELGWGNLSDSFFAFMCDLLGLMTPKAAKIAKALRVYKANTYHILSKKIHEAKLELPINPTEKQVEKAKQDILQYAECLPQFSIEEVEYIFNNVDKCDIIIEKLEIANFKTKNVAWKEISTAMHIKTQSLKHNKPKEIEVAVISKINTQQNGKTKQDIELEMKSILKQINSLHSSLIFASRTSSTFLESTILIDANQKIESLQKEYIRLAQSIGIEESEAKDNLANLIKQNVKEKMTSRVNLIKDALQKPDLYGNIHSQLQLVSIQEYQAEYLQLASLIGIENQQASKDLEKQLSDKQSH